MRVVVEHGVGQWLAYNAKYSAALPATTQPASELIFFNPMDTTRPWNPSLLAASLAAIDARGRIPLGDIALRGNEPLPADLAAMGYPLFGVDNEIASSTKWDGRLHDLINVLKAYKKPVMLRIGGEFSGNWNGYHPYDYPKAFRKIVIPDESPVE